MEAPVPASALIHSATLVSAGIYLILRFNTLFNYTQFSHLLLPVIGSLTAAYGGICAVTQTDLKKILAYSTISHCGFLVLLCSLEMNEFVLCIYTYMAFLKLLFLCVLVMFYEFRRTTKIIEEWVIYLNIYHLNIIVC